MAAHDAIRTRDAYPITFTCRCLPDASGAATCRHGDLFAYLRCPDCAEPRFIQRSGKAYCLACNYDLVKSLSIQPHGERSVPAAHIECANCTLHNAISATICEACEQPLQKAAALPQTAAVPPQTAAVPPQTVATHQQKSPLPLYPTISPQEHQASPGFTGVTAHDALFKIEHPKITGKCELVITSRQFGGNCCYSVFAIDVAQHARGFIVHIPVHGYTVNCHIRAGEFHLGLTTTRSSSLTDTPVFTITP